MSKAKLIESIQGDELSCPRCISTNIVKAGSHKDKKQYRCADCGRWFVEKIERIDSRNVLDGNISPNEMRLLDIWDLRVLGKKASSAGAYSVNFAGINIDWLKLAIKDYLWTKAATMKTRTIQQYSENLKKFAKFLEEHYIEKPQNINRQVILDYFNYLASKQLKGKTRSTVVSHLKFFLEYCYKSKEINFFEAGLIFPEDYPKREKSQVKDIPPYILKQLDENLHYLAKPIGLQVEILKETGMRISEVCNLKLTCVQPDSDGDWWLDIYREKMDKQNRMMITKDLAIEIIEQQKYIREKLGTEFTYLFCDTQGSSWFNGCHRSENKARRKELNHFIPVAKPIHQQTLRGYLYYLAIEHSIADISGDIYPIWRCHQFRHTHLTDCARKGMGIAHIMQRAGHLNPAMSMEYIHLTNEDQKQAMKDVWDNTHFDIEGEIVASPNPNLDTADLQWIKKGMNVQTSDNGYCTLLATQNCIHQNLPCKECGSWATTLDFLDAHKKDLLETEKIIENARAKGWQRQVEKNVPRAERLQKIVNGMEKHKNMKGLGHNEWEKEENNESK